MKKLLFPLLLIAAVCAGCDKNDYEKLEGTVWRAITDETIYTLHFEDESTCTVTTARNDDTFSVNMTAYTWRYTQVYNSRWGLFLLEDDQGNTYAGGTVENKTLYLLIYSVDTEPLTFKRQ